MIKIYSPFVFLGGDQFCSIFAAAEANSALLKIAEIALNKCISHNIIITINIIIIIKISIITTRPRLAFG